MRDELERAHTAEHAAVIEARGREDGACGECGGRGYIVVVFVFGVQTRDCPACQAADTSQPHGLGNQKGEQDGKQGGVHPDRTREVAEGPHGRGVHAGSSVLDRPGLDPQGRHGDGANRGLTNMAPGGANESSPGADSEAAEGMPR